jgi:YidC/Oxa1 family membrane protein insertase
MDNRRLLLAALLSLAVIVGWQLLFPPPKPVPVPPALEPLAEPARESEAPAVPLAPELPAGEPAAPAAEAPPIAAAAEERVVLESGEVRAEFTNRGGELVSFTLKRHLGSEGELLDLVRRREAAPYLFALGDTAGMPLPLAGELYAVERGGERPEVTFVYRGAQGSARKRFTLRPDGLLEVEVEAHPGGPWTLLVGPGIRNPPTTELASSFLRRGGAVDAGGKVERYDAASTKETLLVSGAGLRWAALQDTYFLVAVAPQRPLAQVAFAPTDLPPLAPGGEEAEPVRELSLMLTPAGDVLSAHVYLGPKEYEALRALPYGLARTVDFGMFGFLARPLLLALHWTYDRLVANYGWAIILLTFAIRILLFPLNHKSIVSMEKMQRVQPKAQAIQQKWRPKLRDRQGRPDREAQAKMNQEIMALYQAEGINPAAGCLPLLLQMPVLFAFYSLLGSAFDLRGAPWFGWIQDLSIKDPYYVLPLVMGATMVIQQRLTPPAADPVQRWMMMAMPIVFTVFFLGFPSGLVLYWLTNNVLAIAQQIGYKKFRGTPAAALAEAGGKRSGKR